MAKIDTAQINRNRELSHILTQITPNDTYWSEKEYVQWQMEILQSPMLVFFTNMRYCILLIGENTAFQGSGLSSNASWALAP